jgi:hypothetical protein
MGEKLGQSVIIANKAGADGLLGIRSVKSSPADGYSLPWVPPVRWLSKRRSNSILDTTW